MGRAAYHVTRRPDGRAETVNKLLTGSSCQRPRQRPSTVNCGALLLPADDDALARWLDDLEARVGRQRPHKRVAPRRRWRRRGRCDRDRAVVSVRSRRHPIPAPARSAAFVRTGTHAKAAKVACFLQQRAMAAHRVTPGSQLWPWSRRPKSPAICDTFARVFCISQATDNARGARPCKTQDFRNRALRTATTGRLKTQATTGSQRHFSLVKRFAMGAVSPR